MSKKKKFIVKAFLKMYIHYPDWGIRTALANAEALAEELEEKGYFDPEPKPDPMEEFMEKHYPNIDEMADEEFKKMNAKMKPKPSPVETENPWNQASSFILPDNGKVIEVNYGNRIRKGIYFDGLFEEEGSDIYVSWTNIINRTDFAEWRYA